MSKEDSWLSDLSYNIATNEMFWIMLALSFVFLQQARRLKDKPSRLKALNWEPFDFDKNEARSLPQHFLFITALSSLFIIGTGVIFLTSLTAFLFLSSYQFLLGKKAKKRDTFSDLSISINISCVFVNPFLLYYIAIMANALKKLPNPQYPLGHYNSIEITALKNAAKELENSVSIQAEKKILKKIARINDKKQEYKMMELTPEEEKILRSIPMIKECGKFHILLSIRSETMGSYFLWREKMTFMMAHFISSTRFFFALYSINLALYITNRITGLVWTDVELVNLNDMIFSVFGFLVGNILYELMIRITLENTKTTLNKSINSFSVAFKLASQFFLRAFQHSTDFLYQAIILPQYLLKLAMQAIRPTILTAIDNSTEEHSLPSDTTNSATLLTTDTEKGTDFPVEISFFAEEIQILDKIIMAEGPTKKQNLSDNAENSIKKLTNWFQALLPWLKKQESSDEIKSYAQDMLKAMAILFEELSPARTLKNPVDHSETVHIPAYTRISGFSPLYYRKTQAKMSLFPLKDKVVSFCSQAIELNQALIAVTSLRK